MDEKINDFNHIQILYNLTTIRIYYVEKMFYLCEVNHDHIAPKMFKKCHKLRDYLLEKLDSKKNINMSFFYRNDIQINKKIMINEMTGYYSDIEKVIYRALLLLID